MTNEEKILEMLGSMQNEISSLKNEIKDSESRMKSYIDEKAKEATSQAVAYAEGAIIPKFDLLADGHALTQQQIAGLKKDIDRIDYQLGQHEGKFFLMEQAK